MLLSFRFANHRSFRDEQQLNLTPVYGDGTEAGEPTPQAVQVVGVFGANASGKSNCLGALAFMRQMVVESDRAVEPGVGLSREPFRLDPEIARQPSRYVVDLMLGGVRHTYGFTIDDDRVLDEWLYHYPALLTDVWVQDRRPGRTGRWPASWSMARAMMASALWNPNPRRMIRRIRVFTDSMRALDRPERSAAMIASR